MPGNTNLRDNPDSRLLGGTIHQHEGPLLPAIYGLIDQESNVINAIGYAEQEYEKWYGIKHKNRKHLRNSIYAITEFSRTKLSKYRIISCPGCYPTSIQIPLIPLIKKKSIEVENIIIDSKSGYSGAGKNIKKKFKFKNLFNSVSAYGVGKHRHMAEIDQELSKLSKNKINVSFTPHLIPMFRGILSTIYVEKKGTISTKKVLNFLIKFYKKHKFIRIYKKNTLIGTKNVINTNYCDISICETNDSNGLVILSAIDNLIKGGAGQGVQNMNTLFNFKNDEGLR